MEVGGGRSGGQGGAMWGTGVLQGTEDRDGGAVGVVAGGGEYFVVEIFSWMILTMRSSHCCAMLLLNSDRLSDA